MKFLIDGYEIVSCIANTSHSKVLLVKHKLLGELRVAKVIECNDKRVIQEANIIKLFRHPQIPIIYDIVEDNNSICIIEEYISGKSLSEYFYENEVSFESIIMFGIQICNVLEYIHNYDNKGLIYLDLKPDNIIVDGDNNIRIIDFDNSIFKGQCIDRNYGSIGFAPPEQYYERIVDYTADIYSLGMVLLYMVNHSYIQSNDLSPVINKCIRHNSFQRFHSVKSVRKELERMRKKYKKNKSVNKKSQSIYIYAIKHGIGATHLALSLASYISRNGYKVILIGNGYEDDLTSEAIKGNLQKDGSFLLKGVNIITNFSKNVNYDCDVVNKYDYQIYDCGVITQENIKENGKFLTILVTDNGYRKKMCNKIINGLSDEVIIAVNHSDGESFYQFVKNYNNRHKFIRIPCIYRWYEKNTLFDNMAWDLLNEESESYFNIKPNKSSCIKIYKLTSKFVKKFILKRFGFL